LATDSSRTDRPYQPGIKQLLLDLCAANLLQMAFANTDNCNEVNTSALKFWQIFEINQKVFVKRREVRLIEDNFVVIWIFGTFKSCSFLSPNQMSQ